MRLGDGSGLDAGQRDPQRSAQCPHRHADGLRQHRDRRRRREGRRHRLSAKAGRCRCRRARAADPRRLAAAAAGRSDVGRAGSAEHIQRVFEQCERNVSETARRLKMHRRTLQRILSKHAPRN
ncbi:MAG: helix-turn-helix domain-containing protein [Aliidongia sp.]